MFCLSEVLFLCSDDCFELVNLFLPPAHQHRTWKWNDFLMLQLTSSMVWPRRVGPRAGGVGPRAGGAEQIIRVFVYGHMFIVTVSGSVALFVN